METVVPVDRFQWEREVKLDWDNSFLDWDLIMHLLDNLRNGEDEDGLYDSLPPFSEIDEKCDEKVTCFTNPGEDESLDGRHNAERTILRDKKESIFGVSGPPTSEECALFLPDSSGWKPGRRNKRKLVISCSLCPMKFAREEQLLTHLQKHDKHKEKTCPICQFPAIRWVGLRRHLSKVHKVCKVDVDRMVDHMNPNTPSFPCPKCSSVLQTEKSRERHIHKHVVDEHMEGGAKPGYMLCKLCGGEFEGMAGIRKHLFLKHAPQLGLQVFPCHFCEKGFYTSKTLEYHISGEHKNEWHSTCSICGKGYHTALELERHMKLTHQSDDCSRFHVCPICQCKFSSATGFQGHMRRFHEQNGLKSTCKPSSRVKRTSGGELECTGCSDKFINRRVLYQHMSKVHPDIAKYKCELCEKRYLTQTGVTLHVKTVHFKETAKCLYCHVVSNNQFNLNKHLRHFCPNAPHRQNKASHTITN